MSVTASPPPGIGMIIKMPNCCCLVVAGTLLILEAAARCSVCISGGSICSRVFLGVIDSPSQHSSAVCRHRAAQMPPVAL